MSTPPSAHSGARSAEGRPVSATSRPPGSLRQAGLALLPIGLATLLSAPVLAVADSAPASAATIAAPSASAAAPATSTRRATPGPTEPASHAMARLVAAMQAQDLSALATLLPSTATLTMSSTLDAKRRRATLYTPRALRRDLDARQGFHELLFGFQGDDSLRDVFVLTDFRAWVSAGPDRFRPPGAAYADGRTFVRWRREGTRWVIAEIGSPDA